MTNFEKIKAMSIKEMAEFLTEGDTCFLCDYCRGYCTVDESLEDYCPEEDFGTDKACYDGHKKWLEREIENFAF